MKLTILGMFIVAINSIISQDTSYTFQTNNIVCSFTNDGQIGYNSNEPSLGFTRKDIEGSLIHQIGILFSAQDALFNTYSIRNKMSDWVTGNTLRTGIKDQFENYYPLNNFYSVTKDQIINHLSDFEDNGFIDEPIPEIFNWPARETKYNSEVDFESLAAAGIAVAPFVDVSNTCTYNPELGDIPYHYDSNNLVPIDEIPNEIMYFTSTYDHGGILANISFVIYAYSDTDELLNNTIFLNIYIQSLNDIPYQCSGISLLHESSFGLNGDDDIATYPYYASLIQFDNVPDLEFSDYSYKGNEIAYISKKLNIGSVRTNWENNCLQEFEQEEKSQLDYMRYYYHPFFSKNDNLSLLPINDFTYINRNEWVDGKPLYFGNDGYASEDSLITNYIFPGDIYSGNGWISEHVDFLTDHRKVAVQHVRSFTVLPNDINTYSFALSAWDYKEDIYKKIEDFDSLLIKKFSDQFWNQERTLCKSTNLKVFNSNPYLIVYPNPSNSQEINFNRRINQLEVYSTAGEFIARYFNIESISRKWRKGIYFLKITIDDRTTLKKLIIQ